MDVMENSEAQSSDSRGGETAGRIMILGVGGGGCNMVAHMDSDQWTGVSRALIDTDVRSLAVHQEVQTIRIGIEVTRSLSTGGDAEKGRRAAEADLEHITSILKGNDYVFLVAGLGGGTSTGALPVIADAARNAGARVISFVSLPFEFEGQRRTLQAESGLRRLRLASDVVFVLPNQRLIGLIDNALELDSAFEKIDQALGNSIYALWRLLAQTGYMNLDFSDIKHLSGRKHEMCLIAYAEGQGPDRIAQVISRIKEHFALDNERLLRESNRVIIGLNGGNDLKLMEIQGIMEALGTPINATADIKMGMALEPGRQEWVAVTVLVMERSQITSPVGELPIEAPKESPATLSLLPEEEPPKKAKKKKPKQSRLNLDPTGKGRFKDVEPTLYDGQDLDIPTFKRRGIKLANNHH